MSNKVFYIYTSLLWLIFGLVYLYPHPDTVAAGIAPHTARNELDNYLISEIYMSWYLAIAVLAIGLAILLTGIGKKRPLPLALSLTVGLSYTFYTSGQEVLSKQSRAAIDKGMTHAVSSVIDILGHQPDFIIMELLFFLFFLGTAIVVATTALRHFNPPAVSRKRRRKR